MNHLLSCLFLVTMFFPALAIAQNAHDQQSSFVKYAERLRELRFSRPGAFSGSMQEIAEEMQKIVLGEGEACENYAGFIAYFSAPRGHSPTAITRARDILDKIESPMEVETMQVVADWLNSRVSGKHQFRYEEIITPLAKRRNPFKFDGDIMYLALYDGGIDCPALPDVLQIPLKFASLGLYDKAWRAYREHTTISVPRNTFDRQDWRLEVAKYAYLDGEKKLGWQLLMNAAVFGNERLFTEVKKTAELWQLHEQAGEDLPRPEILQGNKRREAWGSIINAYQDMNAHPRAWMLVDEYPDEFENPQELKKNIQENWVRFTNMLLPDPEYIFEDSLLESVTVYGYRLYPDGVDPLTVEIPWAFSEGSIERAKEDFRQGAKEILSGDILRYWHSTDGKFKGYAKMVSNDEVSVTLKQENGKIVTFELSDLSPDDQEYVRLRLEAKTNTGMFALPKTP